MYQGKATRGTFWYLTVLCTWYLQYFTVRRRRRPQAREHGSTKPCLPLLKDDKTGNNYSQQESTTEIQLNLMRIVLHFYIFL